VNGISKRLYFRFDGHVEALTKQFGQAWLFFMGLLISQRLGYAYHFAKQKGAACPWFQQANKQNHQAWLILNGDP
jgi:hypothetical protein